MCCGIVLAAVNGTCLEEKSRLSADIQRSLENDTLREVSLDKVPTCGNLDCKSVYSGFVTSQVICAIGAISAELNTRVQNLLSAHIMEEKKGEQKCRNLRFSL